MLHKHLNKSLDGTALGSVLASHKQQFSLQKFFIDFQREQLFLSNFALDTFLRHKAYNGVSSLVMNKGVWDSLTAEQQGWLDEAAKHYLEFGQEYMADYYATAAKEMEDAGATLYYLSPEEEAEFLACTEELYEAMKATCTEKGVKLIELVQEWNAS